MRTGLTRIVLLCATCGLLAACEPTIPDYARDAREDAAARGHTQGPGVHLSGYTRVGVKSRL